MVDQEKVKERLIIYIYHTNGCSYRDAIEILDSLLEDARKKYANEKINYDHHIDIA